MELPEVRQCAADDDRFNPRGSVAVAAALPGLTWLVGRPAGGGHWVPDGSPELEAIAKWPVLVPAPAAAPAPKEQQP